jgi:hypothetical protein
MAPRQILMAFDDVVNVVNEPESWTLSNRLLTNVGRRAQPLQTR